MAGGLNIHFILIIPRITCSILKLQLEKKSFESHLQMVGRTGGPPLEVKGNNVFAQVCMCLFVMLTEYLIIIH